MSTAGEQIRKRKEEESVSMAVRIRGQNIDRETNKKTGRKSHEEGGEKKKNDRSDNETAGGFKVQALEFNQVFQIPSREGRERQDHLSPV